MQLVPQKQIFEQLFPWKVFHSNKTMNVKILREKAGISQQTLADQTGIPKDRIAKWEQGKGSPKASDFMILDKFFAELLPRETDRASATDTSDAEVIKGPGTPARDAAMEVLRTLSAGSLEQAQANKQQAEANYLSEKNRARILEILQPTAGADPQTIEATIATVLGLRKYIAQLAADLKNAPLAAIVDEIDKIVLEEKSRVQSTGSSAGVGM